MFAVIKTGGKQYRVVAEDVLRVDRLEAEPGTVVEFGEVLVVGGDTTMLGTPTVAGATVGAEVLGHERGAKVIAFKKRRRKNSRRKRGHRQEYSLVRITEILTEGKKPSQTPPPRPKLELPPPARANASGTTKRPTKSAVATRLTARLVPEATSRPTTLGARVDRTRRPRAATTSVPIRSRRNLLIGSRADGSLTPSRLERPLLPQARG